MKGNDTQAKETQHHVVDQKVKTESQSYSRKQVYVLTSKGVAFLSKEDGINTDEEAEFIIFLHAFLDAGLYELSRKMFKDIGLRRKYDAESPESGAFVYDNFERLVQDSLKNGWIHPKIK